MIRLISTTEKNDEVYLYYSYTKSHKHFFKVVVSEDGFSFNGTTKYVIVTSPKGAEEPKYDWKHFSVSKQKDQYVAVIQSDAKKNAPIQIATSAESLRWTKIAKVDDITEKAIIVPEYQFKNRHVMYFGEKDIKLAYSSAYTQWKISETPILTSRPGHFDDGDLEIANIYTYDDHIMILYYSKHQYDGQTYYKVGAAGIDRKDPTKVLWRSEKPLWEQNEHLRQEQTRPLGIQIVNNELICYWVIRETTIYAVSCSVSEKTLSIRDKDIAILLDKHHKNPIISPNPKNKWESRATFNSAALYEDGKVHFLYRALGDSDLSVIGYATSKDGLHIDERHDEPIYLPREPFETPGGYSHGYKTFADHFASGGGYGGIEDPRVTKVGDRIYLTYVAFDGWRPPRAAMSWISVENFRKGNWEQWSKAKLISPPGMVNKSAVIFPEKINGKYAVIHRVYPNILIDELEDLEFEDRFLTGHKFIPPRKGYWDSKKIGAGAPPMLTKDGWLLIYQSVGYQDPGRYKIGAMVLDYNDPSKVLYRTNNPILSPEESYENDGFKAGVVYPCGAVIKDGELLVYYGGADTFVCAAKANLDTFLSQMKEKRQPKLQRVAMSN